MSRKVRVVGLVCLLITARCAGESPSPSTTAVIAHRGLATIAPENTLPAVRAAVEAGCEYVEVDVRLARDKVPVLFHDATLDRTTDGSGPLEAKSLSDLRKLDAGSWFRSDFRGVRIPTLAEVIAAVLGKARLYLDLKTEEIGPVVAVVRAHRFSRHVAYRAYTLSAADEIRRLDPEGDLILDVGQLTQAPGVIEELARSYPGAVVSADFEYWSLEAANRARRQGLRVFVNLLTRGETRARVGSALELRPHAVQTVHPEWVRTN